MEVQYWYRGWHQPVPTTLEERKRIDAIEASKEVKGGLYIIAGLLKRIMSYGKN